MVNFNMPIIIIIIIIIIISSSSSSSSTNTILSHVLLIFRALKSFEG